MAGPGEERVGAQEYITPEDVKNAFEQVYRDVGILPDDITKARAVGTHYVAVLRTEDAVDAPSREGKLSKGEQQIPPSLSRPMGF